MDVRCQWHLSSDLQRELLDPALRICEQAGVRFLRRLVRIQTEYAARLFEKIRDAKAGDCIGTSDDNKVYIEGDGELLELISNLSILLYPAEGTYSSVELANSRPIQQLFDVPEIEYYGNNNFGILYTKLKAVHNFDICRDGEVVLELLIAYLQVTITYCGKILNYEAANMIQPSLDELTILHQELCQEWCNNEAIVDLWSKLQGLATQLRLYESRVAFLEYEPAGLDGIDFQNLCSIRQRKEEVQNDIDAKYSELSALCSPRISNKRCSRLRREIYRMQDAELELRRWGVFGTGRAS